MIKAMFSRLCFEEKPLDHAVCLACHLMLAVGPTLDRADQVGGKLVDYVTMRLKELKGGNYSEPTRFSLTHVTDLRAAKWQLKRLPAKKEKKKKSVSFDVKA